MDFKIPTIVGQHAELVQSSYLLLCLIGPVVSSYINTNVCTVNTKEGNASFSLLPDKG
jgi:hypothetical protein